MVDSSDSRTHHLEPARIRLGHGLVADAPPRRERPRAADERARRLLGHHARRGHDRGGGDLDDLRARLDAILDLSAERLAGLPDDRLERGARWSEFPVTVGFRLGRWASHIREHGIQIEKTFAMIDHVPTEPARLARNMLASYGRAESVVFGRQDVDQAVDRIGRSRGSPSGDRVCAGSSV